MPQRPSDTRARASLSRGALLSLLLHVHLLVPLGDRGLDLRRAREEARARARRSTSRSRTSTAAELPKDLPPIEPPPPTSCEPPKPPSSRSAERRRSPRRRPPNEAGRAPRQKPKPEPEVAVPPMPPMPRAAAAAAARAAQGHEKMVDLDNDKEVEPPPDAKYLAQKNNRADEETRATDTNLEKAQKGEQAASAPSERDDPRSAPTRRRSPSSRTRSRRWAARRPTSRRTTNPELARSQAEAAARKSLLALRDPAPRAHELTPETADPSLPRAADGEIAQPRAAVRGADSDPPRQANGKRVKLALSRQGLRVPVRRRRRGRAPAGAEAAVDARQGKFQQRAGARAGRAGELHPRGQARQPDRAQHARRAVRRVHRAHAPEHPQAVGLRRSSRTGTRCPGSSPLNNPNLLDDARDGAEPRRHRRQGHDRARVRATCRSTRRRSTSPISAGPYPDPPREIRSANGKIYVHWRFYRDERQCATSGVDYFILDNPPADARQAGGRGRAGGAAGRARAAPARRHGAGGPATGRGAAAHDARRAQGPPAPAAAWRAPVDDSAASARRCSGWTRGGEARRRRGPHRRRRRSARAARGRRAAARDRSGGARGRRALVQGARRGRRRARWRRCPRCRSRPPARTSPSATTLAAMLKDLAGEEGVGARPSACRSSRPPALRAAIGKLPPDLDDGTGAAVRGSPPAAATTR